MLTIHSVCLLSTCSSTAGAQQDCSVINNNLLFLFIVSRTFTRLFLPIPLKPSELVNKKKVIIIIIEKIKKCDTPPSSFCQPLRTNFTGRQAHYRSATKGVGAASSHTQTSHTICRLCSQIISIIKQYLHFY